MLVIPITFTTDHIETLSELDIEYAELAEEVGITNYKRAPALNDSSLFYDALADIVLEHMRDGEVCTPQYPLRCPGCTNAECRNVVNPVAPFKRRALA